MSLKKMLIGIVILSAGFGGYCTYLYLTQDSVIFEPQSVSPERLNEVEKRFPGAVFKIESPTGVTVQGYEIHKDPSLPIVIYFGGNCEEASLFLNLFDKMKDFHLIFPNYPGYGLSGGVPSQRAFYAEAITVYDYFKKRYNKSPEDIFLIGRSIGTPVATYLASQREVNSVCLITPFDSIRRLAQEKYPLVPVSMLLKYPFESIKYAPEVKAPCLFLLAQHDDSVPEDSSRRLAKAWGGHTELEILPDVTHANVMDAPDLIEKIKSFFQKRLVSNH